MDNLAHRGVTRHPIYPPPPPGSAPDLLHLQLQRHEQGSSACNSCSSNSFPCTNIFLSSMNSRVLTSCSNQRGQYLSTSCQLGTLLAQHAGEMCSLSEVSSTDLLLQQKSFPLILLTACSVIQDHNESFNVLSRH